MPKFFHKRDMVLSSLALLLVGLYVAAGSGNFALDDGWIHQTYARNLAQYGEWSFIPGDPSAASTSPLYTFLLSVGYHLNINFRLWTHGLGALALALTAILGAHLTVKLAPNSKWLPFITGLALLLTWHHIWAAASGMETLLFGMLTLLLIFLAWSQPLLNTENPHLRSLLLHGVLFGISAALTTLARPEGIVLVGISGLLLMLACLPRHWRSFFVWMICAAVGFFIFISPYLLLNLQLTGGLLPDTAAAKFEQHAILLTLPYPVRVWQLFLAIIAGGQALLLPGIVYFGVAFQQVSRSAFSTQHSAGQPSAINHQQKKSLEHSAVQSFHTLQLRGDNPQHSALSTQHFLLRLLPLLWAIALILLYAARLPASYQHGRYVLPALPSLVLVGVIGTGFLLQKINQRKPSAMFRRVITRVWLIAIGIIYLLFAFITGVQVYRTDVAIIDGEMVAAAHWIRENVPPDELLAIHDIGAVGYFAPRPMIDVAGLITPELIPFVANPEAIWNYLQEQDARYLLAFPNQIPGRNPDDPRLCPIYTTNAAITQQVGEPNMTLYRLVWDKNCAG
jgi:hypothetical protein